MARNSENCWDGDGGQEDLEEAASKQDTARYGNICFTEKICHWGVQALFLSKIIIPFPWAQFRLFENDFTPTPSLGTWAEEEEPFPCSRFYILSSFQWN